MIPDKQTNFVYLADSLPKKYPAFAKRLVRVLQEEMVDHAFLPGTIDVWAVDYMPIQVANGRFIQFSYRPDYLISTKKWSKTISDVDAICKQIGVKTEKVDIVLDGGNVVKEKDRILMTTKIFTENPRIPELELIQRLKDLFEINTIQFLPVEQGDWLGHADGMARFINTNTVAINDYSKEETGKAAALLAALNNCNLKWELFPYNPYQNQDPNDANGLYLNYLEMEGHIFLPIFDLETDQKAIDKAESLFPGKRVIPVLSSEPAKHNGIINCLTWNIKQ